MVAKIKTNDHGDCIFTEENALDLLYTNPKFDISKLFFESPDQYNNAVKNLNLDLPLIQAVPKRGSAIEFDQKNCETW